MVLLLQEMQLWSMMLTLLGLYRLSWVPARSGAHLELEAWLTAFFERGSTECRRVGKIISGTAKTSSKCYFGLGSTVEEQRERLDYISKIEQLVVSSNNPATVIEEVESSVVINQAAKNNVPVIEGDVSIIEDVEEIRPLSEVERDVGTESNPELESLKFKA